MASINCKVHPATEDNLEIFLLYWLDAQVNTSDENQEVQKQLRSIIDRLKIFDDQNKCQQVIESLSEQDRLILIVSGQLGRQIVPRIHQLRQLSSIYVYCMDKKSNEEWSKPFTKVKEVIVNYDELIAQIKSNHKRIRVKIEEPILFNTYTIKPDRKPSEISLNTHFAHSLIIINALLRIESSPNDKQQLISRCKKVHKGNKSQLDMMDEFNDQYTSNKAVWWYTRESFLYKMLNEALRVENIDLLLSFHFIISDIYEQLKQNQCKSPVRVYCGHIKRSCELKYFENPIDQYLSINSFLLTSTNRDKVLNVLNNSEIVNGEQKVLFIIDADPNVVTTKSFADISKFSSFIDEGEVLFMIGSIFRLTGVEKDGQILTVQMQLCNDNEPDLEHLYESMKKIYNDKNEDNKIDHRAFGDILHRMGKNDLAETIYHRLIDELPSKDSLVPSLYRALGVIRKTKGDYDSSLKFYRKSLEIQKRINSSDYITIGVLYGCIGEVHLHNKNDIEALRYFEKAINLYQKENAGDHHHMAGFYDHVAAIYKLQMKFKEALDYYEKALNVDARHSSPDSLSIAKSHNNIGNMYCFLNQYDRAMECYQLSLSIKLKIVPPQPLSIAKIYGNIGHVYKTTGDLEQALIYYRKADTIYRDLLPSQHPDVIETGHQIQNLSRGPN